MTEQEISKFIKVKRSLFDKHYSFLNAMQREAVYTVNGPLLVLAGAGSGKTTVLVNRIAHIIKYGDAYYCKDIPEFLTDDTLSDLENARDLPDEELVKYLELFAKNPCPSWNILAITFTNKAANEMKERLSKILGQDASEIWAGTFHAICMKILRSYGDIVGYTQGFSVCDTDDSKKAISACMKDLEINDKILTVKEVMTHISKAKEKLMSPEEFSNQMSGDFKYRQISKVYELYQKRLMASNVLDFDDIIMKTVELFRKSPEVLSKYQNRFKYICVDEYQDTNMAQFELVSLMAGFYGNIMVVGDDDQSIYKFRGATIENILSFDSHYSMAKVIKLEQNYRSTSNILNAANSVIANNYHKHIKNLWSSSEDGEKIIVKETASQSEESKYIVDFIADLKEKGKYDYKDFAILYRANAQSQNLETYFAKSGLPYRILGGLRFFDREEVKDIISYLSVINNPRDNIHLRRIIGKPKRRIGQASIDAVFAISEGEGINALEVMENAEKYNAIPKTAVANMVEFSKLIKSMRATSEEMHVAEFVKYVIKHSGYEQMLISAGQSEEDRLKNLEELVNNAKEYEDNNEEPTLVGYLEQVALVADVDKYDESADAVTLMTIHSAKGLEFPVVFLPGMEDGVFPSQMSMNNPSDLEEERRLAYVAITRAKKQLVMVHAKERMTYGMTQRNPLSRFVKEIDSKYLDVQKYSFMPSEVFTRPRTDNNVSSFEDIFFTKKQQPVKIEPLAVGDRVSHVTFGEGTVIRVSPMSSDFLYEIMFDNVGTKKLMAMYTRTLMKKI